MSAKGGKRYQAHGGAWCRLTDCCGSFSTYGETEMHEIVLCCKSCWGEVEEGQGDGAESVPTDPYTVGARVAVAAEWGDGHAQLIPRGETGEVVNNAPDGSVWVRMDSTFDFLQEWDNEAFFVGDPDGDNPVGNLAVQEATPG